MAQTDEELDLSVDTRTHKPFETTRQQQTTDFFEYFYKSNETERFLELSGSSKKDQEEERVRTFLCFIFVRLFLL